MEWEGGGGGGGRTDRIMNVGQRGGQLLGLASDFGRVMSASDSSSVPYHSPDFTLHSSHYKTKRLPYIGTYQASTHPRRAIQLQN